MTDLRQELKRLTGTLALTLRRPSKRIVLINDREDILKLFKFILEPTYEVEAFLSGADALAAIIAHPPDLVITDWARPEAIDGRELIERLRCVKAELPVLLVSGYVDALGRPAGVTSCLSLPCNAQQLSRAVRALIGDPAP